MEEQHQRVFICDESSHEKLTITLPLNNRSAAHKIPMLSRTKRTTTISEKQSTLYHKIDGKDNHLSVRAQIDTGKLTIVNNFPNTPEGRRPANYDPYKNLSVVVAMWKLCKLIKEIGMITVDLMVSSYLGFRFTFMQLYKTKIDGFLLPPELLAYEKAECISGTHFFRETVTFILSQLNINIFPLPARNNKNYYQRCVIEDVGFMSDQQMFEQF